MDILMYQCWLGTSKLDFTCWTDQWHQNASIPDVVAVRAAITKNGLHVVHSAVWDGEERMINEWTDGLLERTGRDIRLTYGRVERTSGDDCKPSVDGRSVCNHLNTYYVLAAVGRNVSCVVVWR